MDILLLTTAAQHATSNPNVILDSKALKKWINNLPEADLLSTVAELHAAIENLNELIVDDRKRFKLLQIYHDALQGVLISYDEMRISMLHISSHQRNKLREDIMWLYLSLANGYKLIIKSNFDKKKSPAKYPVLLYAMYLSMELIIDGLIYSYRSHLSPPPLARLEINQIFYYAYLNKVADIPVKAARGCVPLPTISRLYKQQVLIYASDPYRLNPADMLDLFLFVENLADQCQLQIGGEVEPAEGKYVTDLNLDEAPMLSFEFDQTTMTEQTLVIDIWPIVNILAAKTTDQAINSHSFSELREKHMIDIIIQQIGKPNCYKRKLQEVTSEKVKLILGINRVHELLKNIESDSPQATDSNDIPGLEQSEWILKARDESEYMLIASKSEQLPELIIGDIVAMNSEGKKTEIALIRWIKHELNNIVKLGVEVISAQAFPVFYQVESDLGLDLAEDEEQPGLYFKNNNPDENGSVLIHKSTYIKDRKINLYLESRNFSAVVIAVLNDSPVYIHLKLERSHYAS